jgi:heme-degrading monooxygenase HmoA
VVIVFEYAVEPAGRERFEQVYGHDGEWAAFFRTGEGYLGTELLRSDEDASRYLVLDRWASAAAYERFLAANRPEYDRRSRATEALYRRESVVGRFGWVGSASGG